MPNSSPRGAGEHVARAQRRDQAAGEGDQQFVAGDRAHAFVDPAEAGHVDRRARHSCRRRKPGSASTASTRSLKAKRLGRPVRLSRSISARRLFSVSIWAVLSISEIRQRVGWPGRTLEPGEADGEMAAADAAAVGGVELEGGVVAGEEGGEPACRSGRERSSGTSAMRRSPSRSSHSARKRNCSLAHSTIGIVADGDDRGGDRQGVEIALADGLEQRSGAAARPRASPPSTRAAIRRLPGACARLRAPAWARP